MAEKRFRDSIKDSTSLRQVEREAESIDRALVQESAHKTPQIWPGVIISLDTASPNPERYTVQLLGGDDHNTPMIEQPGVARPNEYHDSALTAGTTVAVMLAPGRRPYIIPGSATSSDATTGTTAEWQFVWNEGV